MCGKELDVCHAFAGVSADEDQESSITGIAQASSGSDLFPEPFDLRGLVEWFEGAGFGLVASGGHAGEYFGSAFRVQVCRAGFAGEVEQVEAVVVVAPVESLLARVDLAQLTLALCVGSGMVGVGREVASGDGYQSTSSSSSWSR